MGVINSLIVNKNACERRAAELGTRRSIKKDWQMAWLMKAINCIDLTTLKGDDTKMRVHRLCEKAKRPIRQDMLKRLGVPNLTTGAVCVYPARVKDAVAALEGTGIPVASVATGFPSGQVPRHAKLEEIREAVKDGAREIDIVLSRDMVITGDWAGVYEEVQQFREACGDAHLKTILATGELPTYTHVAKASMVCMMAGADFIKTSTGMEAVNATLPVGLIMCRMVREYHERYGYMVGFKPAGGVSTAKVSLVWLSLIMEELGEEWLNNTYFRIGASSLLGDIERQLWHGLTGQYAASSYMPMG